MALMRRNKLILASRSITESKGRLNYQPKYEYSDHWGEVEHSHAWKNLADRSEDGLRDLVDDVVERIVRIVADPRQDNPGKHRYQESNCENAPKKRKCFSFWPPKAFALSNAAATPL